MKWIAKCEAGDAFYSKSKDRKRHIMCYSCLLRVAVNLVHCALVENIESCVRQGRSILASNLILFARRCFSCTSQRLHAFDGIMFSSLIY